MLHDSYNFDDMGYHLWWSTYKGYLKQRCHINKNVISKNKLVTYSKGKKKPHWKYQFMFETVTEKDITWLIKASKIKKTAHRYWELRYKCGTGRSWEPTKE